MSPYQLIYGKTCHLPIEVEFKAHWAIKRWNDKRIKKKEFVPKDKVLLFNFRVKLFGHGKLRSKWEGPFKVINTLSHGAVTQFKMTKVCYSR